jgi:hypothetical protein
MDFFECVIHYGGYFRNRDNLDYVGKDTTWRCDSDKWSYWELLEILEGKGVKRTHIIGMWYHDPINHLGLGLREIKDDKDAMKLSEISLKNGIIHVYCDNGPNYVIGRGKYDEEVGDNDHHEVVRESNPTTQHDQTVQNLNPILAVHVENDVHSEIFGDHHDLDSDVEVRSVASESDARQVSYESDENGVDDYYVQPIVAPNGEGNSGGSGSVAQPKQKKKKKGRPRKDEGKKKVVHEFNDDAVSDKTLYEEMDVENDVTQLRKDRGLSDDEVDSDEVECDGDYDDDGESDNDVGELMDGVKFPTFKMLKDMTDYKWEIGTYFATKKDFIDAIRTYSVHSGRKIAFYKNDGRRMRVRCDDGCPWTAYCAKLQHEGTWQLRKIVGPHTCAREPRVNLITSEWLSHKLLNTVRENPNIRVQDIQEKAKKKWNITIHRCLAGRARQKARDILDGSFREQYTRLYDYCHELLKRNPGSTIKIATQPCIERPLVPYFQRMYVCLKGCKESFYRCRPIIGLDGCFLKGYFGGQILAAIGRDPNDQMLPIAFAVVEGETKDSWTWFLQLLINDLGGPSCCSTYTFMSDQQKV